ncbi:MAG: hypothetical protein ACOC71_03920, partial [Hyphomicrobiales bacterium]
MTAYTGFRNNNPLTPLPGMTWCQLRGLRGCFVSFVSKHQGHEGGTKDTRIRYRRASPSGSQILNIKNAGQRLEGALQL